MDEHTGLGKKLKHHLQHKIPRVQILPGGLDILLGKKPNNATNSTIDNEKLYFVKFKSLQRRYSELRKRYDTQSRSLRKVLRANARKSPACSNVVPTDATKQVDNKKRMMTEHKLTLATCDVRKWQAECRRLTRENETLKKQQTCQDAQQQESVDNIHQLFAQETGKLQVANTKIDELEETIEKQEVEMTFMKNVNLACNKEIVDLRFRLNVIETEEEELKEPYKLREKEHLQTICHLKQEVEYYRDGFQDREMQQLRRFNAEMQVREERMKTQIDEMAEEAKISENIIKDQEVRIKKVEAQNLELLKARWQSDSTSTSPSKKSERK